MAKKEKDPCEQTFANTFWAMVCYMNMFLFSKLTVWFRKNILRQKDDADKPGYACLYDDYGAFYIKCIYGRFNDCFSRPIASTPGPWIDVIDRTGTDLGQDLGYTGNVRTCLNLGSYNYLGFADDSAVCLQDTKSCLEKYSTTTAAPRINFGTTTIHQELERLVARFVGKEDAVIFGMGYATNSTVLPSLVGKGGLIISDTLNHASIIVGIRSSVAEIRVFKHNDPKHLEQVLRNAILNGQPRTRKPWTKILIVVEGVYSMEGEICRLPEIVAVKNKYKAYLYVDEAHSIGAMGKRGRGVCDYWGIDTAEVDILMGTFTKSFGSAGGYIAASKDLITNIRALSYSSLYDTSMSAPCAQQVITSMKIIMGEECPGEGTKRLEDLRSNSIYFRRRLKELGFAVFGDNDSPIIPVMLYSFSVMVAFSRLAIERNIAVVVAGYPAVPLLLCRARFCMSAAHTKEDLEWALAALVEVGDWCGVRSKNLPGTIVPKKMLPHKRANTIESRELVALVE